MTTTKTTVVHHSADFDGLFCREIARRFLPDAEFIGWDFKDKPLSVPEGRIYVLDLPVDRVFGFNFPKEQGMAFVQPADLPGLLGRVVWIDHHKSSIESHPRSIPGYRIDGVAACRLAWQWFTNEIARDVMSDSAYLPTKELYVNRSVKEPLAVRLAGEYDIWDKRDPHADTFQFALRSMSDYELPWKRLLSADSGHVLTDLLDAGAAIERYQRRMDEQIARSRTFDLEWEGVRWLAINAVRCNSMTFEAAVDPARHDALLGFYWTGSQWIVSMYHAPHRKDLDLSKIAVKHGGGGHAGACGFQTGSVPWVKGGKANDAAVL